MQTIGTCSICGGAVVVPQFWGGATPPVPSCNSCGATKRNAFGEVIQMEEAKGRTLTNLIMDSDDSTGR